jgi:16S rRNA (cytidine1402-2'-O)-methyltransferase
MGTLFIIATPIGNLDDITIRAIKTIFTVNVLACEDTRRTGMLLSEIRKRHGVTFSLPAANPKLIRFDNRGELNGAIELIGLLEAGQSVGLVSDAGTPLVSDPGYVLISQARKRGIRVESIPGASALLAALTSSGLPADKFTFFGYPPEKASHRMKLFNEILDSNSHVSSTYIFYAAPHKLIEMLENMKEAFGDIEVTLARELTKIHEEIRTERISTLLTNGFEPKGEFVLLFRI